MKRRGSDYDLARLRRNRPDRFQNAPWRIDCSNKVVLKRLRAGGDYGLVPGPARSAPLPPKSRSQHSPPATPAKWRQVLIKPPEGLPPFISKTEMDAREALMVRNLQQRPQGSAATSLSVRPDFMERDEDYRETQEARWHGHGIVDLYIGWLREPPQFC